MDSLLLYRSIGSKKRYAITSPKIKSFFILLIPFLDIVKVHFLFSKLFSSMISLLISCINRCLTSIVYIFHFTLYDFVQIDCFHTGYLDKIQRQYTNHRYC